MSSPTFTATMSSLIKSPSLLANTRKADLEVGAGRPLSTTTPLLQNSAGGLNNSSGVPSSPTTTAPRGFVRSLFPRRLTLAGTLVIFAAGFLDGALCTHFYLSRTGSAKSPGA